MKDQDPGSHERIVAFGWIMFSMMMIYMLMVVLTHGCAMACGTPIQMH
jgi:hypothetical protein